MTNEDATPPSDIDALIAAGTAREAVRGGKTAESVKTPAAPATQESAEKKAESSASVETRAAVDAKASAEGKSESPAPAAKKPHDVSKWLPENLRAKAEGLDPELATYLEANVMRRSEYERWKKTERGPVEEKARLWDRMLKEAPRSAKSAMLEMDGKLPAESDPSALPDSTARWDESAVLDPSKLQSLVQAEIRRIAPSLAKEQVTSEFNARVDAPKTAQAELGDALRAWKDDSNIDDETFKEVVLAAHNSATIPWTPSNVVSQVEPWKEVVALRRQMTAAKSAASSVLNGSAAKGSGGLSDVASPNSRGSAAVAPADVPKHIRDGKIAKTSGERLKTLAHIARADFGVSYSDADLERLLSGQ